MYVIKTPAGFDPTWPALPVDPWVQVDSVSPPVALDLAALLGPKNCGCDDGQRWESSGGNFGVYRDCLKCEGGKVPQRVALAIETPDPCDHKRYTCDDIGCDGPVRLRVEYTAQVDAVVPIIDAPLHPRFADRPALPYVSVPTLVYDMPVADELADWSPGRVAILISDVWPVNPANWAYGDPTFVRPFDGPVAELSEVLS